MVTILLKPDVKFSPFPGATTKVLSYSDELVRYAAENTPTLCHATGIYLATHICQRKIV